MRKLKVVVLGYYHVQNAGDDLLLASICSLLKDCDVLVSKWFPGIDLLNAADLVVVGGGSIWPGHTVFQFADELVARLGGRLMVVGISAKQASPGHWASTQKLVRRADLFWVRDAASLAHMGCPVGARVAPDLYWWTPHEVLPRPHADQANCVALNLRSWEAEPWQPEAVVAELRAAGFRLLPWPFFFGSAAHEADGSESDDALLQRLTDGPVPRSFSMHPLESAGLAVCMRFHAILAAIRAGVPVIGFDYHRKTRSLFEEIGLPELCVPLNDPAALRRAVERVQADRARYLACFAQARAEWLDEGRAAREEFLEILARVPARQPSWQARARGRARSLIRNML